MTDTITREQALEAYNSAPDPVRKVFNDEQTTQIVIDLQTKFQLHIDQAGTLGKEVGYLLLGITDPSKFINRLKANGFADQIANAITMEINQKIFVPLRAQIRNGPTETDPPAPAPAVESTPVPEPPKPPLPTQSMAPSAPPHQESAPVPSYMAELQKGMYAPPPQSPSYPNQHEDVSAYVVRPLQPRPAKPINRLQPPVRTAQPTSRPVVVAPTNPLDASKLLEDHEEGHIEFPPLPSQTTARTAPPPPNLPGAMPFAPDLSHMRPVSPTSPAQPKPAVSLVAPVTPARPYSVDPYREPIEDEGGR